MKSFRSISVLALLVSCAHVGWSLDIPLGVPLVHKILGHGLVLEVDAVPGHADEIVIRWGNIDHHKTVGQVTWLGGITGEGVTLVNSVKFEKGQDKILTTTPGSVTWETHTTTAWDGVVVKVVRGSKVKIRSGSGNIIVHIPA